VIGSSAGGAIMPAWRITDSNRFSAARTPGWIDWFPAW
jgi:hypothetical protein